MSRSLAVLMSFTIVSSACASSFRPMWSAEVKNSDAHLSEEQRGHMNAVVERLHRLMPNIARNARAFAIAVNDESADGAKQRNAAAAVADDLARILSDEPDMTSIMFTTGDYLSPVSATRGEAKIVTKVDFGMLEPGLREQVGFFPEGPQTMIEDLAGYPRPQFAVATRGSDEMRIRIPFVANGYYLGDLVAEYKLK